MAIDRQPIRVIVAIALVSATIAGVFATRSVAGADASGYVSEAAMLMRGQLFHHDDLFEITTGHDAYLTSPLGWRPAPSGAAQSPTYPPGLPLLMAVPHALAGINGASALVIVCGIMAIIATGLSALRLGGATAGVIAAAFIAFTPIFLHQSIQPMSDVPVTAAWMLCFWFAMTHRSLAAGIACAMAVLIRPNLSPLAIVPLFIVAQRIAFAAPVAVSAAVLAMFQWSWYGSPLRSGYGSAEQLFALSNIAGNVQRYAEWFLSTAPAFALAILGVFRYRSNRVVQALAGFALLVVAAYLVYAVFDDWSYLRFLLPAMAVFAVLAGIELAAWIDRWPGRVRIAMLFAVALIVTTHALWTARNADTFKLSDQLRRVSQVADAINHSVPPEAVIVSGEQSGSMRYYTGRSIVRWEAATATSMADALGMLQRSGRPVYVVLDAWEEEPFRKRIGDGLTLDWPPALEAGTSHRTRMWSLADRARFHAGDHIDTARIP